MLFSQKRRQKLISHQGALVAYATALSGDPETASDLAQEAMVRALRAPKAPSEKNEFKAWLFTIVRNLWLDHWRKRGVRNEVTLTDELDRNAMPLEAELVMVNALAVRLAFEQLSADHRDVLSLVDIGGFSYAETAKMLDISIGTVMSRVSRARQALIGLLQQSNIVGLPVSKEGRR